MNWSEILEIAKTKPREGVLELIDAWVVERPELAEAGNRAKGLLDQFYAIAVLNETVQDAIEEVLILVSTGEGPLSTAPEIGLV